MTDENVKERRVVERSGDGHSHGAEAEVMMPIVVSLGKKKKKDIRRLKRGKGRAMEQVMDVIDQVQENLGEQADGKILVPVVVIYRQKQRRFRGLF